MTISKHKLSGFFGDIFFRGAPFFLMLLFLYLFIVLFSSVIVYKGRSLAHHLIEYSNEAGGDSESLIRLRDAAEHQKLDVLFMGSSHAYRTFDTRIFQRAGLKAFNLGTVAQTPLNSYYLLQEYYIKLRPEILVLECYPLNFQSEDGMESFMDLVVNMPLSASLWGMAIATHSPQAIHLILSEYFQRLLRPFPLRAQTKYPDNEYVPGGYVEVNKVWDDPKTPFDKDAVDVSERQLSFLKKIIYFCKKRHLKLILVLQPMPPGYLISLKNYEAALQRIKEVAKAPNVLFKDYNDLEMDLNDFAGPHTLNARGAEKISRNLLETITTANTSAQGGIQKP